MSLFKADLFHSVKTNNSTSMRPLPGDDAFAERTRSSDDISRAQPPMMTYFLADEKTMESSSSSYPIFFPKVRNSLQKSNFGVESYETITSSQARDKTELDIKLRNSNLNRKNLTEKLTSLHENDPAERLPSSNSSPDMSRNISPSPPQNPISRPYTPLSPMSPALASFMSTPDSQTISEGGYVTDDIASQDLMISRAEEQQTINIQSADSGFAPQFVMPSIKMPSRRPFTEKGKNMGRLKLLIAGDSGKFFANHLMLVNFYGLSQALVKLHWSRL